MTRNIHEKKEGSKKGERREKLFWWSFSGRRLLPGQRNKKYWVPPKKSFPSSKGKWKGAQEWAKPLGDSPSKYKNKP